MNSKELGAYGEKIASEYLKKKGYRIIDKNFLVKLSSLRKGEIDIVSKKNGVIAFIEVKTLSGENPIISPQEKVNFQKQRQLVKISQLWLIKNKIPLDSKWQIDIVAIILDPETKKAEIRHFENAVSG